MMTIKFCEATDSLEVGLERAWRANVEHDEEDFVNSPTSLPLSEGARASQRALLPGSCLYKCKAYRDDSLQ